MQYHEKYLTLMSLSPPNLLDLKITNLMSCQPGEQTMLDYIGDIMSVMQNYVV